MLKFMLGIAIVAFTSFCGYLLARKYRQRKDFFLQLREFNERFLSEISYYRRPLQEFISKYSYKGDFQILLQSFLFSMSTQKDTRASQMREVLGLSEFTFLKEEEKQSLEDYFLMLGKGDSISQKTYFSSSKDQLKKWCDDSDTVCKKYSDLYVKIGFLLGLLILILII